MAHALNLVAQEVMKNETMFRDYLSTIRDIVSFVRDFLKRLVIFKSIQAGEDGSSIHTQSMQPFCPTRWCCRISLFKSILQNYEELILFFEKVKLHK